MKTTHLAALSVLLLAGCGNPVVPGQHTMACVNAVLGTDAPPPAYEQVARNAVRQPYDARFGDGTVYLTRNAEGGELAAHESARQAIWFTYQRQATEKELAEAERRCGASKRRAYQP